MSWANFTPALAPKQQWGKSSQHLTQPLGLQGGTWQGRGLRGALITTTTLQPREPGGGVMQAIYSQGLRASRAGSTKGLTQSCRGLGVHGLLGPAGRVEACRECRQTS